MKKKKISKIQLARLISQIFFFILLPGLFVNTFVGIKGLYQGIANNNLDLANDLPNYISAIAILPITLLLGRFFCGWMCAFGSIGDWIYRFSSRLFHIKFKVSEESDRYLKFIKYIILGLFILLIWNIDLSFLDSANPWNAFGVLATVTSVPDFAYAFQYFTVGTILLISILIASAFIERFFCRYLCPLGAVFTILSTLRIVKIKKPGHQCGSCTLCTKKCSMGIPMYRYDKINSGECIQCFQCIPDCPRKNTRVVVAGNDMSPALAGALAVTTITGLYYVGTFVSEAASPASSSSTYSSTATQSKYIDGTYEGSATGFRRATTIVSVTVEDGQISDIEVVSYGDDRKYFSRAYNSVISDILSSQSTDVDAVSGATFSSNGIMNAVANALEKAENNSSSSIESETEAATESTTKATTQTTTEATTKATTETTSKATTETTTKATTQTTTEDTEETTLANEGTYVDGVYEGSGTGFRRGVTKVSVTVEGGNITDIEVVSYGDDAPYFKRAYSTVVSEILSSQSTDVDAVSGATYSSRGIMNAVADALSSAVQ